MKKQMTIPVPPAIPEYVVALIDTLRDVARNDVVAAARTVDYLHAAISRAVAEAVEAEREECAKFVEDFDDIVESRGYYRYDNAAATLSKCAAAIREGGSDGRS